MVFLGNCQAASWGGVYRDFVAKSREETIRYVPNYRPLSADSRKLLEDADVIAEQFMDGHVAASSSEVVTSARILQFPMITGGFLWPYGGVANIHNRTYSGRITPPYDAEVGDSYLDREILAKVSVEEAVRIYVDLSIDKLRNPTRLMELVLDRQHVRDTATGFSMADYHYFGTLEAC